MTQINLKDIEKKAFRSTYQDGLWDIYYGLIVVFMAIFVDRPEEGYSWVNIAMMALTFMLCYGLFWAGKKFLTVPRMGKVVFGEIRRRKKRTMSIVLGIFVFLQFLLLIITAFGWMNPRFGSQLGRLLGDKNELFVVSLIAALIVCIGMSLSAYFSDFIRGYYIAILMSAAVFLILFFQQPIFPLLVGTVIILPGLFLLVRFLKQYPLPREGEPHE